MNNLADIPVGQETVFQIQRAPESDATFDMESLHALASHMVEFVLTQLSNQWELTGAPPSTLVVHLRCEIQ